MLKASGQPLNSLRGFVIWRKSLYAGKAKSLYFDLCIKLLNMTKLPTSEKKKKTTNELLTLEEINLHLHGLTGEVTLPSNCVPWRQTLQSRYQVGVIILLQAAPTLQ